VLISHFIFSLRFYIEDVKSSKDEWVWVMNTVLQKIRRGMVVIDQTQSQIGTVDSVKFSDEYSRNYGADSIELDSVRHKVRAALTHNRLDSFDLEDVPAELWENLLREGFVRVDAVNQSQKARYILPHQILSVSVLSNEVRLNVTKAALVKRS
jgi:hypothetical protein